MEDGKVSGLTLKNLEDGLEVHLKCQGIFPYIGHIPETSFVKDLGVLDERGYLVVDRRMRTAVPGDFRMRRLHRQGTSSDRYRLRRSVLSQRKKPSTTSPESRIIHRFRQTKIHTEIQSQKQKKAIRAQNHERIAFCLWSSLCEKSQSSSENS